MREHLVEIERIAADQNPPTFANTIRALEDAGRLLDRVALVFWNLASANSNDELQAIERDIAPRLAEHSSIITSNAALFARIDDLYARRDQLGLTPEELRLLERKRVGFVRAGAALSQSAKTRAGEIKQRLATLSTQFSQNVLADEKAFVLPLRDDADRAGLPGFVLAAAAAAARELGAESSHVVTLNRSLIEPFLTFSTRRDLREQAFRAWQRRGENAGATDNRAHIGEILALRREYAKLLGYGSYGDYKLDDTMAKHPRAARSMLEAVWTTGRIAALRERDKLQAVAASEGANIRIEPWDWRHYAEKVRRADYDLDEAELKPYLPLDQIIAASFDVAKRLFGLTFEERHDIPRYHPDVRAWEVKRRDGSHLGVFLADYFARANKRSGAWMSEFRNQETLAGNIRPIIVNVMNFAKGEDGKPALLSFDDARTLFHEFGHGLHGLLSDVTFPSLAGTSVASDFVELPSQLYEHWLSIAEVLRRFARHYQTGEPMPDVLIDKLRAARTFNQGFQTVEYLASALVDLDAHALDAEDMPDAMALQQATLERIAMPAEITMRHGSPHFQHIYSGDGYAAGYYSYMWSEMLDADAFAAFEQSGDMFDPQTAERLLKYIYAAGNLQDPEQAYLAFRGRLPTVDSVLRKRGLVAAAG